MATKTASKPKPVPVKATLAKANFMDATRVKTGDIIKVEYYTKVIGTGRNQGGEPVIKVQDMYDPTNRFAIEGKSLIDTCLSADQFNTEEELTMTDLADKVVHSIPRRIPFCAGGFKDNGEFRIYRGKLKEFKPNYLGMVHYEDYDVLDANRDRQINLRTLQFFILENIRYTLKGAKRSTWLLPDGTLVK